MRVESINLNPVKATKAVPVSEAQVELSGLRHDRRWAVVDLDGKRLNATHHDSLLAVTATPDEAGNLTLAVDGREPQSVRAPAGGRVMRVNVSRLWHAVDAGDIAAQWFSEYLRSGSASRNFLVGVCLSEQVPSGLGKW